MESPSCLSRLVLESDYKKTGQIIFGLYGMTAQHSYFQLLHQGTQDVCVDIVARFRR